MTTRNLMLSLIAVTAAAVSAQAPAETGKDEAQALLKQNGCLACHSQDRKVMGPSWQDIAVRYKGNAGARDELIAKVKAGGKGNWEELTGGASMPAYGKRVSEENIAAMVDFLLSL